VLQHAQQWKPKIVKYNNRDINKIPQKIPKNGVNRLEIFVEKYSQTCGRVRGFEVCRFAANAIRSGEEGDSDKTGHEMIRKHQETGRYGHGICQEAHAKHRSKKSRTTLNIIY
jgi:hypothetical protein